MSTSMSRSRWAAIGAAVAISLGAGGIGITHATTSTGEKPVYIPIEPCRLADTRPAPDTVGTRTAGIGPAETYTLSGWGTEGNCTLPSDTAGLALNVTAVGATQQTNLRFFPAGIAVPSTANLNPTPGAPPTPNAVNVNLSSTGEFSIYNAFGTVAVVIDVMGIYDDHNHDDRYYQTSEVDTAVNAKADADDVYTKTETDAAIAAAQPVTYFAQVSLSGTIDRASPGVTLTDRPGEGVWNVVFPTDVSSCGWVASLGGVEVNDQDFARDGYRIALTDPSSLPAFGPEEIGVVTYDETTATTAAPFGLIVTC